MKKKILLSVLIFLTIFSAFAKDSEAVFGNYQIKINDFAGTYCLYVLNPQTEKFVPVLNTLDSFSKNKFYLKAGNRVYPLSKMDGVSSTYEIFQQGATLTYKVKDVADVSVRFTFANSVSGKIDDADIAIVDILVKNTGKVAKNFSVRGVFDTVLGESYAAHFSTKTVGVINNEARLNSMVADKWIKSANDNISIKFLLDGPTISTPSNVVLANASLLSGDAWDPRIVPGRGFSSLFSINNSAVAVTWNPYKLTPGTKCNVRFYISCGSLGIDPCDTNAVYFVSGLADKSYVAYKRAEEFINAESVEYVVLTSNDKNVDSISAYREQSLTVANVPQEKLNQEYINSLLRQIEELEQNPDKYDQTKIIQLNAELDAVLKMLGQ